MLKQHSERFSKFQPPPTTKKDASIGKAEERSPVERWNVSDADVTQSIMMLAVLVLLAACLLPPANAFTIYGYGNDLSVGLIQNVIFDVSI